MNLVGPKVPATFEDNGCSKSPDAWWCEACRTHDYEYHVLYPLMQQAHSRKDRKLKKFVRNRRREADKNLMINMLICSRDLTTTQWLVGWWASGKYYIAVRAFGWRAFTPNRLERYLKSAGD